MKGLGGTAGVSGGDRLVEILPALQRLARHLAFDLAEAEDLVQETAARVLETVDRVEGPLLYYGLRILRNLRADELRRAGYRRCLPIEAAANEAAATVAGGDLVVELRETLRAIGELAPRKCRAVIAAAIGSASPDDRVMLCRARGSLKRARDGPP